MPFVRISVPQRLSKAQLQHISNAVHQAMVSTFNVPAADLFQVLTRHPPEELICSPEYLGITHSSAVAFIQITCNEGRTLDMKKALFSHVASEIAKGDAISAADVIVNLVEVQKENWSFGNGIAQYAT
jgi:4-oxalocrotonate tautomerase